MEFTGPKNSVFIVGDASELPSSASPGTTYLAGDDIYIYDGDNWLQLQTTTPSDGFELFGYDEPIANLKRFCPALDEVVKYPQGDRSRSMRLEEAIIRLNDVEKWPREKIADWLESLDLDLAVNVEDVP